MTKTKPHNDNGMIIDLDPDTTVHTAESESHNEQELEKMIRFGICSNDDGDLDIYSCATRTNIIVPKQDIEMLIGIITNFHRQSSPASLRVRV